MTMLMQCRTSLSRVVSSTGRRGASSSYPPPRRSFFGGSPSSHHVPSISSTALPPSSSSSSSSIILAARRRLPPMPQRRNVWTSGREGGQLLRSESLYPNDPLTPIEIARASSVVRDYYRTMNDGTAATASDDDSIRRFVAVSLREPPPSSFPSPSSPDDHAGSNESRGLRLLRRRRRLAEVVILNTASGLASELLVDLDVDRVIDDRALPSGTQPMLTPDDCALAEDICKSSPAVVDALGERYGITDVSRVAADPWSLHLSADDSSLVRDRVNDRPRRLVQTFLYARVGGKDMEDNQYAHPIDIVPVIDLISGAVVRIDGMDRPPPAIPARSVNYHRNLLGTNDYLQTSWRADRLRELSVIQPDGPSFDVADNNLVSWQGWTFRVGFNYREGLVLHDVKHLGRSVLNRASLVEMAVPYGDPRPPFTRKCAFDVGDYGLGYCANSLELGCDCLGHIHYFDVCLSDSSGMPYTKKKAICMHEEDRGLLWKHVEYRDGHSESRRSRELVISSIATVVNYEYLFYWRFKLDGTIEFEIGLTGELSTNLVSHDEDPNKPSHGVLVAPGVNAQVHQHMFCARLDVAVDGPMNTVTEVDVLPEASPHGNAFRSRETVLKTERGAIRTCDASKARSWKISNAEGKTNPITGKPTSYKLLPFTKGPSMPTLLTADGSSVSNKGQFGCANLWVTPFDENERYPAGEHTPQNMVPDGLPRWIEGDRNVEAENIVVWHAFGVTHVPRVEDFPVMPVEHTGFSLKPDGFFSGNPSIDIEPEVNKRSKLNKGEGGGCCP
ncbi:hypothetical protein ACHAXA_007517 [Cyclostephanos tholiformis]|uniref:Amine oxidase n=1 Tax=Cyclostephanos tholiformis TaxID=382380 RepID=A0ABD3RCU9_9STRA